jgi:hypothetical protein
LRHPADARGDAIAFGILRFAHGEWRMANGEWGPPDCRSVALSLLAIRHTTRCLVNTMFI